MRHIRSSNLARNLIALALVTGVGMSTTGCVEELGLIDRTQANRVAKEDLRGVWYKLEVISGMPRNTGFGFVGQSYFGDDEGGKVIFDVQEELLLVYPVGEKVVGSNAKWTKKKIRKFWDEDHRDEFIDVVVGDPVAAFPISSHFDVIRDYNSLTGRQTNVLVENTSDRPWFERDYMRVDWSANQLEIPFFQPSSAAQHPDDGPLGYYVQENDEDNPNRFYMSEEADYFHFTDRIYTSPASTGWCSTYAIAPGDCSAGVFDVRVSFKRADPKVVNDYEIREFHNAPDQDKFGFFLSDRYAYDEDQGLTYTGHDYKANRWNLWQKSKNFVAVLDADGNERTCIQNDDCYDGEVCDQEAWFEEGVCSKGLRIPYSQRGLKPIIYHLGPDFPSTHRHASYETADHWSDAFKESVSWQLFWEEKWAKDGITSFNDPDAKFGQRLCQSHADCAQHARGSIEIDLRPKISAVEANDAGTDLDVKEFGAKSNRLVVATSEGVVYSESVLDTQDIPGGKAFVMFVNATPGSGAASLQIGPVSIPDVEFAAGEVPNNGQVVDTNSSLSATVTAGGQTASIGNVELKSDRAYWFVYFGGDGIAVLEGIKNQSGIRAFNAYKMADNGGVSDGPALEVGVNGTLQVHELRYGYGSEFGELFADGNVAHVVFLEPGQRADVSCQEIDGVAQCSGWRQKLTDADRARRVEIKNELPDLFILCDNTYSGDACTENSKGNPDALNDCRYWQNYDQHSSTGSTELSNPCARWVPSPEEPKGIGDIRYNYIYWVSTPHASSPLGYGPSAGDPDTGMLIWATAYIYGSPQNTYATYAKDLIDLLNGDLSMDSLQSGKYIRDYVDGLDDVGIDDSLFEGALADGVVDATELAKARYVAEHGKVDMSGLETAYGLDKFERLEAERFMWEMETDPAKLNAFLDDKLPRFDVHQRIARLEKVKGSKVEQAMLNDEIALVMSGGDVQPGEAIAPEMMDSISPAGWATPMVRLNEAKRVKVLARQNIYMADFQDPSLLGIAQQLKCKEGETPTTVYNGEADFSGRCFKGDALRTVLNVIQYRGVTEHEIGHTVGLRHNFSASADIFNYHDPYYSPSTGRERDFHYCADPDGPDGLDADNMCEEALGERCRIDNCNTDAECPGALACVGGQCADVNGTPTGYCEVDVETFTSCTEATVEQQCGSNAACVRGMCAAGTGCAADGDCGPGAVCGGGVCRDSRSGKVIATEPGPPLVQAQPAMKFMPRVGLTENERANRRTEYQYASIMDYGQKVNDHLWGLGKYDYAAIKFGYGDMVEVYADPSYMYRQLERYAAYFGGDPKDYAWRTDTWSWRNLGLITHPFAQLNSWMPADKNLQRDVVPWAMVEQEQNIARRYGRDDFDRSYHEVPYRYCSDEYRGGSNACYYFDTGADTGEIVWHAAEALDEYYVFDAFKRERLWFGVGGSPSSYIARISDRWMNPMGQAGRFYAIYNNIFRVYPFFAYYDNHPLLMRPLREASERSFKMFAKSLASPAPGAYTFDAATNTYENSNWEQDPSAQLNIRVGQGKYPWTTFTTENGYYFADHPRWIGAYWEKVASILTMTNSTSYFLSDFVGEQLPIFRGTAIGFNTIYPRELALVLGGLAAGATDQIGGYVETDALSGELRYEPRDPFMPNEPTKARVAPSISNHSLRMFTAWQAIANLPAGFDPSFTDSMAVWLKGSKNEYDFGSAPGGADAFPAPVVDVAEFEDPWGQKTYVAPRPNYSTDYFSPTYYMVEKLNTMKAQWQAASGAEKIELEAAMKKELEVLDYFRNLYSIYGSIGTGI